MELAQPASSARDRKRMDNCYVKFLASFLGVCHDWKIWKRSGKELKGRVIMILSIDVDSKLNFYAMALFPRNL